MKPDEGNRHQQRGAALPTVLVVLFVLTVLGMLALTTAGVDVRLAANERDYQRALYAAEAGAAHMRALLHAKMTSNSWDFAFSDPDIIDPADPAKRGIKDKDLAGYRYNVWVYDRWDTDGDDDDNDDADGKIMVCAEAVGPLGTRAGVEMRVSTVSGSSGEGGGYSQAGAGADKSFAGDDAEAITDTTLSNLGSL